MASVLRLLSLVCHSCQTLDLIDSVPRNVDGSGGEESATAKGEGEGGTTALEAISAGGSGSLESEVSVAIGALRWCKIGVSPRGIYVLLTYARERGVKEGS